MATDWLAMVTYGFIAGVLCLFCLLIVIIRSDEHRVKDSNPELHDHRWLLAKHLKDYSPNSLRWCKGCGTVQILTFDGWEDRYQLTDEKQAWDD